MRDALSLLDQAIAHGGGQVGEADVRTMLGLVSREAGFQLLGALATGDGPGLLAGVAALADLTPDFGQVLQDLLRLLHRTALYLQVPQSLSEALPDAEQIKSLAQRLSPEAVQLYYQIGLLGQQDLDLAPDPRTGLEMVLLRMLAFRPEPEVERSRGAELPRAPVRPSLGATESRPSKPIAPSTGPGADVRQAVSAPTLATAEDWHQFVACLTIGGVARQLAHNCELVSWDGTHLRLKLDPSCNQLRVTSTEERLKRAVEEVLGVAVRLHLEVERPQQETPAQRRVREAAERQQAVEATLMADPLVQAIQEQFGAQWVPGSIKPGEPERSVGSNER